MVIEQTFGEGLLATLQRCEALGLSPDIDFYNALANKESAVCGLGLSEKTG